MYNIYTIIYSLKKRYSSDSIAQHIYKLSSNHT